VIRLSEIVVVSLILILECSASFAIGESQTSPATVVASPEFIYPAADPPNHPLLVDGYYNPSIVQSPDQQTLLLFLHASDPAGAPYEYCIGDHTVLFSNPADYDGFRSTFSVEGRVSPCTCTSLDPTQESRCECPYPTDDLCYQDWYTQIGGPCCDPWGFGLGSVVSTDSGVYVFLEYARVPHREFEDFKGIIVAHSADGISGWSYTAPVIQRSRFCTVSGDPCTDSMDCDQAASEECTGVGVLDPVLVSAQDYLWGFFQFGTNQPDSVGRVRVYSDSSYESGFRAEILSGGVWKAVATDGSLTFLPDIVAFTPGTRPNALIEVDGKYELWTWRSPIPDPEPGSGCDEVVDDPGNDFASGSEISKWTVNESEIVRGPMPLHSLYEANPTRNMTGRILPAAIVDQSGYRHLFWSSSNRVCEIDNSAVWPDEEWPRWLPVCPDTNPECDCNDPASGCQLAQTPMMAWFGLEIVEATVSDHLVEDRFSERGDRPPRGALAGTETEIGGRFWSTNGSDAIRVAAGEGWASNWATPTGPDVRGEQIATIPFDVDGLDGREFSIEADVVVGGSEWAAIGFTRLPITAFWNQAGGGGAALWVLVHQLGTWSLFEYDQQVASGAIPDFDVDVPYHVELVWERKYGKALVRVGDLGVVATHYSAVDSSELNHAGFEFFDWSDSGYSGETYIDNFSVDSVAPLFFDSFESADTSAWSETCPPDCE